MPTRVPRRKGRKNFEKDLGKKKKGWTCGGQKKKKTALKNNGRVWGKKKNEASGLSLVGLQLKVETQPLPNLKPEKPASKS